MRIEDENYKTVDDEIILRIFVKRINIFQERPSTGNLYIHFLTGYIQN